MIRILLHGTETVQWLDFFSPPLLENTVFFAPRLKYKNRYSRMPLHRDHNSRHLTSRRECWSTSPCVDFKSMPWCLVWACTMHVNSSKFRMDLWSPISQLEPSVVDLNTQLWKQARWARPGTHDIYSTATCVAIAPVPGLPGRLTYNGLQAPQWIPRTR